MRRVRVGHPSGSGMLRDAVVPMSRLRYEVGDVVACSGLPGEIRTRLITAVRPTGYTWEYIDRGQSWRNDEDYISENSSDPMLEYRWKLVLRGARRP